MPGSPATTPRLGLPRYDNATDEANFASQINAITDTLDTKAALTEFGFSTGDLKPTAVTTAPTGWLFCDGSEVDRTTYSALFTAIGTAYGTGNGTTTFNLPDLGDRVAVGVSNTISRGDTGGAKTHTLGTSEMPAHAHPGSTAAYLPIQNVGPNTAYQRIGQAGYTASDGIQAGVGLAIASQGGGVAHNNMQPYVGINWLIKT